MIEIFKTNVEFEEQCHAIIAALINTFASVKVNFDLEDCDKILRVEGHDFSVDLIIETVQVLGYRCEVLP
jgi:hypothetical protein